MFLALAFSIGFFGVAHPATITITLSGSALPGLTGTPTKTYTVSDADLQAILNWAAPNFGSSPNATNAQIFVSWLQSLLITPTISSVQSQQRALQAPPPPISIQ